ncbi:MAG: class I SAM-dependent methyltransferase [Anaerolineae bacterium]|nr:class I SAM-dependent methyltransferase [Anaerolineae bacterium]
MDIQRANKDHPSYTLTIAPDLKGVPETMLWALYNRAAEARRPDALMADPLAIQIADAIEYDYARSFGRPESGQVIRALLTDQILRAWVQDHPGGQVVALGEGLETQFHRVDDGHVRWLAVDLPEAIAIRSLFLPDSDRHHNLACSALDLRWMEAVNPHQGVFVTAVGLLKYFHPQDVHRLIAAIAERYATVEMVFDVMPHFLVRLTQAGWYRRTPHYTAPAMYWGLNRNELSTLQTLHPNITEVREIDFRGGRGVRYRIILPLLRRLPWIGNFLFSLVHILCRPCKDNHFS